MFYAEHGQDDADADICECWGEGYHGENIKVAVLDNDGYYFEHPDMQGQFLNGWDCVNDSAITGTIFLNKKTHAMSSASIIAAKANNYTSSNDNKNAVGVAFNSKIIPILRKNNNVINQRAIQQSIDLDADVINMSFGKSTTNTNWQPSFKQTIIGAYDAHGIFLVGATGNEDKNALHYPAAWPKVFGVGATDPNDLRGNNTNSSNFGTWTDTTEGSNYYIPTSTIDTLPYSVVAPGTRVMAATTKDSLGIKIHETSYFSGSSASTPLVSGIAAIMLSKNPNLTPSELASLISVNAEKVRSDEYDYDANTNWPGYNNEMFYGRVNCPNALSEVDEINNPFPLKIGEFRKTFSNVFLRYLNKDELQISINTEDKNQNVSIKIFAINGQLIQEMNNISESIFNINISNLSNAMYFINIEDKANQLAKSIKFLKQ